MDRKDDQISPRGQNPFVSSVQMPSLYKKYKSYIPAQQTPHWICLNSQKLGAKGMKDAELAMAGYRLFRKVHVENRNVGWSSHSIRGCCPISATLGTRHSTK